MWSGFLNNHFCDEQLCMLRAGLTAIDVAINARNVYLTRKLEAAAQFQALLLMKVPKWGGLGTEWRQRCAPPAHACMCPHVPCTAR
jgi:hypothetical protein